MTACREGRTHRWKLAPTGPVVLGVCQNCAAKRYFNNSAVVYEMGWDDHSMIYGNGRLPKKDEEDET